MRVKWFSLGILCLVLLFSSCPVPVDPPQASDNAYLASISSNEGSLNPVFNRETLTYQLSAQKGALSVNIQASPEEQNASVDSSQPMPVSQGVSVTFTVTAEDGRTTKEYSVEVLPYVSASNANLSSIANETNVGTLSPAFNSNTLSYTLDGIPKDATSVNLVPSVEDAGATVVTFPAMPLSIANGDAPVDVSFTVTAEDGTTKKVYTVKVVPYVNASNANLSSISNVSNVGTLSPAFNPNTLSYTLDGIPKGTTSVNLAPTLEDAKATVASSTPMPLTIADGGDPVDVRFTVTAEDGRTKKVYTVKVIPYVLNNNADLSSMSTSLGSLTPAFNPSVTDYQVKYPLDSISLTIKVATADVNATPCCTSMTVNLNNTSQNRVITVTAEDGVTKKNYNINISPNRVVVDPTAGNMVFVPTGKYQRDSIVSNITEISAFYMGECEVTRALYDSVMGTQRAVQGTEQWPITDITWYEMVEFCNRLSLRDGFTPVFTLNGQVNPDLWPKPTNAAGDSDYREMWHQGLSINMRADGYRMPTEAEFYWAAMGADIDNPGAVNTKGIQKVFAGEDNDPTTNQNILDYVNIASNGLTDVGQRLPNELGLKDLTGNAMEWMVDIAVRWDPGIVTDPATFSWTDIRYWNNRAAAYGGYNTSLLDMKTNGIDYTRPTRPYLESIYNQRIDLGFRIVRR